MKTIVAGLASLVMLSGAQAAVAAPQDPAYVLYPRATLFIATPKNKIDIAVEIAKSPKQMEHGLMYRTSVPEKTGMIFLLPQKQPIDMWMKNTLVSLDMLFIDEKGNIVAIAEHTTPESTELIPSHGDVLAVLELAGGSAKRLHIAKGDKVIYPYFHE